MDTFRNNEFLALKIIIIFVIFWFNGRYLLLLLAAVITRRCPSGLVNLSKKKNNIKKWPESIKKNKIKLGTLLRITTPTYCLWCTIFQNSKYFFQTYCYF